MEPPPVALPPPADKFTSFVIAAVCGLGCGVLDGAPFPAVDPEPEPTSAGTFVGHVSGLHLSPHWSLTKRANVRYSDRLGARLW